MARTLILLFDGTSNEISATRSNVLRLYGCLTRSDEQIVWYDPGVGTFGARNGSKFRSDWETLKGLTFGTGLEDNVLEGYRFLVENWQPGDQISLFGFSRGAYTARVLSGFLFAMGLLKPEQLNMLEYAYRAYQRIPVVSGANETLEDQREQSIDEMRLYRNALKPRMAPIHFLGLWDTVSSLFDWRALRFHTHPYTEANPGVAIVRHALAIDEKRIMFRPFRWRTSLGVSKDGTAQDVKEVWFAGAHSDVGGGYIEPQSALAKVPLVWMLGEAKVAGLSVDDKTIGTIVLGTNPERPDYVAPNGAAAINASMGKGWRAFQAVASFVAKLKPKAKKETGLPNDLPKLGARDFGMRDIEEGALIHQSAVQRRSEQKDYAPINWPKSYLAVKSAY